MSAYYTGVCDAPADPLGPTTTYHCGLCSEGFPNTTDLVAHDCLANGLS
jgi:hypothetical protein